MRTFTTIKSEGEKVYIIRFINKKLYKIEFSNNVLVKDVCKYFNINNELFIKCCR